MRKYQVFIISFMIVLSAVAFASCSATQGAAEEPAVVSEGIDTPVTITGYKDFGKGNQYFLKEGDKIAVIAPSSIPDEKQIEATMNGLKNWGYIPVKGKYVSVKERTLENCIRDLKWALSDPEIKAVFCVRGGYAASEVMDVLPLSEIQKANKPIIGYSDISTYLSAWTMADLMSIHAPMSGSFDVVSEDSAKAVRKSLKGQIPIYSCQGSDYDVPGTAEGILIGGNLATLTGVLNTAYDCTRTDKPYVLFLEEIEEDYQHIHRFLTILKHRGVLDQAEGIIFGEWVDIPADCESYNGSSRGGEFLSVADMISREFFDDWDKPVAFGFPAGHGDVNYPLLMGAKIKLNVGEDNFTMEWVPGLDQ